MLKSKRFWLAMILVKAIDILLDSEYDVPEEEEKKRNKYEPEPERDIDTVEVK